MDDAKSSTYFGSNEIEIAGETFSCELEWGEWEGSLFDQIEEEYEGDDADDYIEEIKDIISEEDTAPSLKPTSYISFTAILNA